MVISNKKELDVTVLHDVVVYADTLLKGRLLKKGNLEHKDVSNCLRITDTIAKLL
jgi:hypothetical protein